MILQLMWKQGNGYITTPAKRATTKKWLSSKRRKLAHFYTADDTVAAVPFTGPRRHALAPARPDMLAHLLIEDLLQHGFDSKSDAVTDRQAGGLSNVVSCHSGQSLQNEED